MYCKNNIQSILSFIRQVPLLFTVVVNYCFKIIYSQPQIAQHSFNEVQVRVYLLVFERKFYSFGEGFSVEYAYGMSNRWQRLFIKITSVEWFCFTIQNVTLMSLMRFLTEWGYNGVINVPWMLSQGFVFRLIIRG